MPNHHFTTSGESTLNPHRNMRNSTTITTTFIDRGTRVKFRSYGVVTLALLSALALGGCTTTNSSNTADRVGPPVGSRSPKMDFTRIDTIAVFPLFPSGQVSEEQFAEHLVSGLTAELILRQPAWKTRSYMEVLDQINKGNLGTGYKNLQADFNTHGSGMQPLAMRSPETNEFLKQLAARCGAQAFIIGSYDLGVTHDYISTPVGMIRDSKELCTVRLSLFFVDGGENWWTATITRVGNRDAMIKEISQSLGQYVGQGTLRQL